MMILLFYTRNKDMSIVCLPLSLSVYNYIYKYIIVCLFIHGLKNDIGKFSKISNAQMWATALKFACLHSNLSVILNLHLSYMFSQNLYIYAIKNMSIADLSGNNLSIKNL